MIAVEEAEFFSWSKDITRRDGNAKQKHHRSLESYFMRRIVEDEDLTIDQARAMRERMAIMYCQYVDAIDLADPVSPLHRVGKIERFERSHIDESLTEFDAMIANGFPDAVSTAPPDDWAPRTFWDEPFQHPGPLGEESPRIANDSRYWRWCRFEVLTFWDRSFPLERNAHVAAQMWDHESDTWYDVSVEAATWISDFVHVLTLAEETGVWKNGLFREMLEEAETKLRSAQYAVGNLNNRAGIKSAEASLPGLLLDVADVEAHCARPDWATIKPREAHDDR